MQYGLNLSYSRYNLLAREFLRRTHLHNRLQIHLKHFLPLPMATIIGHFALIDCDICKHLLKMIMVAEKVSVLCNIEFLDLFELGLVIKS